MPSYRTSLPLSFLVSGTPAFISDVRSLPITGITTVIISYYDVIYLPGQMTGVIGRGSGDVTDELKAVGADDVD